MTDGSGYFLATGAGDVERLRLLEQVYGPGSHAMLTRVGLRDGMRVVEVGCGSGNMTCWLAERVGPGGSVVAVDDSPAQVEQARRHAEARGLRNVSFAVANAYSPGLPAGSFDLAYCRLVLMHLSRPLEALRAMRDLVRPGGRVACGEMDNSRWLCDPPSPAMDRLFELIRALGARHGEDYCLGASLHRLFREAGFAAPEAVANFPLALRGEGKRLLGLTFAEFAPELIELGLASQEEAEHIVTESLRLADDPHVLFGFPLIVQVWAQK